MLAARCFAWQSQGKALAGEAACEADRMSDSTIRQAVSQGAREMAAPPLE